MKYILNFDLSILNIFQMLKINRFVNYLLLNKYLEMFSNMKWNVLRFISFKDKLKVNIWNRFENRIFTDI